MSKMKASGYSRVRSYQPLASSLSKPPEISKYFDRRGVYVDQSGHRCRVVVRVAVFNEYDQLRFLILPHLAWVPADRVKLD